MPLGPRRRCVSLAIFAIFSLGAVRAQAEIPALNAAAQGATETYYAGAWQRYGFHEDGLLSAVRVAELLLGRDPWAGRG